MSSRDLSDETMARINAEVGALFDRLHESRHRLVGLVQDEIPEPLEPLIDDPPTRYELACDVAQLVAATMTSLAHWTLIVGDPDE